MRTVFRSVSSPPLWFLLLAGSAIACGAFVVSGCGAGDLGADACAGDDCQPCTDPCTCDDVCGGPPGQAVEAGALTALALPDGRLAIATYDEALDSLVVIFQRPGSSERTVQVVSRGVASDVGRWVRLALESTGALQIAWFDADFGAVRWTRGGESGFGVAESVSATVASHVALAVDGADRAHVAFRDERARGVRYATRMAGRWTLTNIQGCAGEADCPTAGAEDFGDGLDLALVQGAGGVAQPRIAFYDARRGDLKLAGADEQGRWTTVTLDGRMAATEPIDTGDVGRFVSLAVTPTRSLGVAYFDATLGALRYLGPAGAPRVVDSGLLTLPDGRSRRHIVGQLCKLRYDSQGSAHIVYVDASRPGLRHARVAGEGPATITELGIPAGTWPAFDVIGGRLVGAYGAFVPSQAPLTTLRLFDVSAEGNVRGGGAR